MSYITCQHCNTSVLNGGYCTFCGLQLQQVHDLEEVEEVEEKFTPIDECECKCKYPTYHGKLKDNTQIVELVKSGYKCEHCNCKMTPRPEVPNEIVKYNRFKILTGLFGASVVAGLIAVGVHYQTKVLDRNRRSQKRKTKKNRRSKRKN